MIHWHVIYVTKSAIHLSFVKKNKNNNHENNSSTQVLIHKDDNISSNALSCKQEKITIPEKINNTNHNSTHEIISTYENASVIQDSTNLIKPPVPKIVTRTPNEPIKDHLHRQAAPHHHHLRHSILSNNNPKKLKTIIEDLLNSNKTKSKHDSPKKVKKSSSLENIQTKLNEGLKPAEVFFSNNIEIPISFSQYIYIYNRELH